MGSSNFISILGEDGCAGVKINLMVVLEKYFLIIS